MKLLSEYTAHRAGLISSKEINLPRLYNNYTAFCRSKGTEPDPYKDVEIYLVNDIYSIKLWWGAICPHINETIIGNYVSKELNEMCEPKRR